MAKVCPKCKGFDVNCNVCQAPGKYSRPLELYTQQEPLITMVPLSLLLSWDVQGIDISAWNGVMDFKITKKKCQYVKLRIGYGNEWKDYRCDTYRSELMAEDVPFGLYWFVKAGQNWEMHADSIAEVAAEFPFKLDLTLDCEYTELGPSATLQWLINLDERVHSNTGLLPEYYSSAGWWNSKVARSTYFNSRRKWVANWTLGDKPYMPIDWTFWNHWQWSADGNGLAKVYGMIKDGDNDMDLDRYNGTVEEFNSHYGTHILPIGEVPPPSEQNFKMIVIVDDLNVRDGPSINYPVKGQIHLNDIVTIQDIAGASAWIQIKDGQWAGKWAAVQTSKRYMNPI